MKRTFIISGLIVLANVLLAVLMYLTFGWHFIRGYNEVGNFLVTWGVIVLAVPIVLIALLIAGVARWRRTRGGRAAMWGLSLSAAITLLSPLYAPYLGGIAKRSLWIETSLIEAARYGDTELVIALLDRGADPEMRQRSLGTTALHYMAARNELNAVKALITAGADVNARIDGSLETPLHWAVNSRASVATLKLLIDHGADPTLEDWKGKTSVDYTSVIPNPQRTEILNALGRKEPK